LHGLPAATTFDGIFLVTKLLAPMKELSPIVTPLSTTVFTPNLTLSPIITSLGSPARTSSGCQSESEINVLAPHRTLFPILMDLKAPITVPLKPQL